MEIRELEIQMKIEVKKDTQFIRVNYLPEHINISDTTHVHVYCSSESFNDIPNPRVELMISAKYTISANIYV